MDETGRNLLTFGFVRDFCKNYNMDIPDDIVFLFVSWLSFYAQFDRNLTHKHITIETKKTKDKYGEYQQVQISRKAVGPWRTAVSKNICKKGDIKSWIFQIGARKKYGDPKYLILGIIDDMTVKRRKSRIQSFCAEKGGFGLFLLNMGRYFEKDLNHDKFEYGQQFELTHNDIIEMELDLTKERGILSFEFHGKVKTRDWTDWTTYYSNIFHDNIDINKQWRAAITLASRSQLVSILPFVP